MAVRMRWRGAVGWRRRSADPEPPGDRHQLGAGFHLHPVHDPGAMELDGLLDHAQVRRDLLVELSRRQPASTSRSRG
jgi:hypothetical protein